MLPAEALNQMTPAERLRYSQMTPEEQLQADQRYHLLLSSQKQKEADKQSSGGAGSSILPVVAGYGAYNYLNGSSSASDLTKPTIVGATRGTNLDSPFNGIRPTTQGSSSAPEVLGVNRVAGPSTADIGLTGANSALQLYGAYRDYKEGNMVGAGIHGATGAALGSTALSQAGYTGVGAETAGAALPILGPVAALYGGYQTGQMAGSMPNGGRRNINTTLSGAGAGAAAGATIGALGGPIGAGAGAVIGGLAGLAMGVTGSSKDKYQMTRDAVRNELVKKGIFTQDADGHQFGTLADGTQFDFSKDGKEFGKPQLDNPLFGKAAAYGNVLATGLGLYGRNREAMATMYANAALSNAGADEGAMIANFKHFAQQLGFTQSDVQAVMDKLHTDKLISDNEYQVFSSDKNIFVAPGAAATGAAPAGGGGGGASAQYAAASKAAREQQAALQKQAVADAKQQSIRSTAFGLLNKVGNTAPIQYPTGQQKSFASNFNTTLNRIIGGNSGQQSRAA